MEPSDVSSHILVCAHCHAPAISGKACASCGYPVGGTAEEQETFKRFADIRSQQLLQQAEKKIAWARKVIYFMAVVMFILGLLFLWQDDVLSAIIYSAACLVYLVMSVWATKNPFGAILICFLVFLILQILLAVDDPKLLLRGGLFKIIYVIAFINGLRAAIDAQKIMREIEQRNAKNTPPYGAV
jgi:cell division protein FtsW (lipid II flippase)